MAKSKRWVAVSCTHGNLIDPEARAKFLDFLTDYNPQVRIHLGDAFEFAALRKGVKEDEYDHAARLDEDFEAGKDFLADFFKGRGENHFLRGNHDERLWEMRDRTSGILQDYADRGIREIECHIKKIKAQMIPYNNMGVLTINGLNFTHGISHAINAGRIMAQVYGDVVFGHTHRPDITFVEKYPQSNKAINTGCLRLIGPSNAKFAARTKSSLSWGHGLAYGEFLPDGSHTAKLYEI